MVRPGKHYLLSHPGFALLIYLQSTNNDSGFGCCVIILVVLGLIIFFSVASSKDRAKAQAEALAEQYKTQTEAANRQIRAQAQAKAAYEQSLVELKSNPASADIR